MPTEYDGENHAPLIERDSSPGQSPGRPQHGYTAVGRDGSQRDVEVGHNPAEQSETVMLHTPRTGAQSSKYARGRATVLVPEKNTSAKYFLEAWNAASYFLLLFAAFAMPFSVAFPDVQSFFFAVVGRAMDVIFTIDIILSFRTAYAIPPTGHSTDGWEQNPLKIAQRYCSCPGTDQGAGGWLWLDLPAVIPGWFELASGRLITIMNKEESRGNLWHTLRLTRFVRFLHRHKRRAFADCLEYIKVEYGIPGIVTEATKAIYICLLMCHLAACVWVMAEGKVTEGFFGNKDRSWFSVLEEDVCEFDIHGEPDPMCLYTLACYWAMMTLTTVGYGDIVPQNRVEFVICTIYMLVAGFVWAYIVGLVVNLLDRINGEDSKFMQEMDAISTVMMDRHVTRKLSLKVREYMVESKQAEVHRTNQALVLSRLSKGLQQQVAAEHPAFHSLKTVFWIRKLDDEPIVEMVNKLEPDSYSREEFIDMFERMIVVQSGKASVMGRNLIKNNVWGEESVLLKSRHLLDLVDRPRTSTFTEILGLSQTILMSVCKRWPDAAEKLRKAQVKTAVLRGFIHAAKQDKRLALRGATTTLDPFAEEPSPKAMPGKSPSVGKTPVTFNNFDTPDLAAVATSQQVKDEINALEERLCAKFAETLKEALSGRPQSPERAITAPITGQSREEARGQASTSSRARASGASSSTPAEKGNMRTFVSNKFGSPAKER